MKLLKTKLGKLSAKKAIILIIAVLLISFLGFVFSSLGELNDLGILRMTGFPGGQDYLLVFQNDAERRPTGGFITAYGTLKFRFGIPIMEFGNVYDDKLIQKGEEFPDPTIAGLIGGPFYPGHGFRDGNFDPDFPTSAKELMRLYKLGYPDADFDGVIAIDFTAFENLAKAIDPEIVGESGLFAEIEKRVQGIDLHDPEALKNRKNFLSELAKRVVRKAIFSPTLYDDLADSIVKSLSEKHIQFYFTDPKLQFRARGKGWTGELPFVADSDLLAINEGNYGGMKSSRYLVRDVEYDVVLETQNSHLRQGFGGQAELRTQNDINSTRQKEDEEFNFKAIADLKIKIQHRGDFAEPISGYYKGYWRIYVPLGSRLISGEVDREYDDGKRQVWGKVMQMNPGEEREISLRYELPEFVLENNEYNLKLVKQAGSTEDHVRVTVKLPQGYLFKSEVRGQRSEFDLRENLAIFEGGLDSDKDLNLKILSDTLPPGLAWQEFLGGINEIDLRFNEPLDPESIQTASFEIKDLDYRNKQTDSVRIQRVRFIPPQNIRLDLSGTTEECREWYGLSFDGVADLHGNALDNQKITIVQWLNSAGEICDPERNL